MHRIMVFGILVLLPFTALRSKSEESSLSKFPIYPPTYELKLPLTPEQKARLKQALAPQHAKYDPVEKMLKSPFSSPGYHTTLKGGIVHSTRSSLSYAVSLLDTGDEEYLRRACDILRRVIALQDQNPASKTYGIWSWFLEEPLDKMSPPDWNWADFCGTSLLQAALYHRSRLPEDLRGMLDAAIYHATRSIMKRNVGPDYTNIAIMGSYVTLVASDLYAMKEVRDYAIVRWRRFYEHTMKNGAFSEYNSPTYTIVALEELGRMRLHVRHADSRRLVEEIYRVAWEEIAQHFHVPTRQWAGPHSRSYSTLLRSAPLAIIQAGTEGRINFGLDQPRVDEHRLPLPCPRDLEPFFTKAKLPRTLVKTFVKAQPPIVGTTHLENEFTLGSINRGDLWNQRRSLVAYWGTAEKPACLQLRFLHDKYDFAAAQFFSIQKSGQVLAGINFATNGGDTHVSLDRLKNGTFRAKDLRLRFEFGGAAANLNLAAPRRFQETAHIKDGNIAIDLHVPIAKFATSQPRWESGKSQSAAWLDVVLYSGEEQTFVLPELEYAVVGIAVQLSTSETKRPAVKATLAQNRLAMEWNTLHLEIPTRPASISVLQKTFSAKQ